MTHQLNLPKELESRLRKEAERRGEPTESVALQLLQRHLPPATDDKARAALAMLRQWREEDATLSAEEVAENAQVLRALDEDRPSYRKLFTGAVNGDAQ